MGADPAPEVSGQNGSRGASPPRRPPPEGGRLLSARENRVPSPPREASQAEAASPEALRRDSGAGGRGPGAGRAGGVGASGSGARTRGGGQGRRVLRSGSSWWTAVKLEWVPLGRKRADAARLSEAAGGEARAGLASLDAWLHQSLRRKVVQRWATTGGLYLTKEEFLLVMEWKAKRQGEVRTGTKAPGLISSLDENEVSHAPAPHPVPPAPPPPFAPVLLCFPPSHHSPHALTGYGGGDTSSHRRH